MLSYINTNAKQNNRIASLGALSHSLQRCTECNTAEVCIFFKWVKIGSVLGLYLKKKIGPYKVCIFVNMGPYEKLAALAYARAKTGLTLPHHQIDNRGWIDWGWNCQNPNSISTQPNIN